MHFLILGGSGRTGSLAIAEALSRGHTVTALVRNATAVQTQKGLTIVQGTPASTEDVERALDATPPETAATAILMTLGSVRETDSPFARAVSGPRMMTECATAALAAMGRRPTVRKVVVMQALGVGDSFDSLAFPLRWMFRKTEMSVSFADHDALDEEVKRAGVAFVLARPARLTDGPARPLRHFGDRGQGVGALASVSRKSVAVFLVDAVVGSEWDGKTPVFAN